MSNPFCPEHDRIHQVLTASTVSLSAVEKRRHLLLVDLDLLLSLDNVLREGGNLLSKIFLIHHVETRNQLHESLVFAVGSLSYV